MTLVFPCYQLTGATAAGVTKGAMAGGELDIRCCVCSNNMCHSHTVICNVLTRVLNVVTPVCNVM